MSILLYDDDVDDVMRAIVRPAEGEDAEMTARPRAILGVLCLADEPNVSEDVGGEVLSRFASEVQVGDENGNTGADRAATEAARSDWQDSLARALIRESLQRSPAGSMNPGALAGRVRAAAMPDDEEAAEAWQVEQVTRLSRSREEALEAAFALMIVAYHGKARMVPHLVPALFSLAGQRGIPEVAAWWALAWLNGGGGASTALWKPNAEELDQLVVCLSDPKTDPKALQFLLWIVGKEKPGEAVELLLQKLEDSDGEVRRMALEALATFRNDEIDTKLVSLDLDGVGPWPDPRESVLEERIQQAVMDLEISEADVRRRYEAMADAWGLHLEWRPD